MRLPTAVCHVVLAALIAAYAASLRAQPQPAGSSALAVQATCDLRGKAPVMRVQLVNKGAKPATVVAGFTAKDKTQVVNSVEVITIRAVTGADEVWMYINPKFALAEGPPWMVTIAPGATFDLELPLGEFVSTMTYANMDPATISGGRLIFQGRAAGKQATAVWTGRAEVVVGACE